MVVRRMISIGVALWITSLSPLPARAADEPDGAETAGPTIAVADFSGQDKEMGRFLADTLLTDLAQSDRLHLVERSEIRQALTELKLQSTGLAEPQQVKKIGKMLGADRLIVGSYLVHDNQLIVNARLLDVRTGKVSPGDAANVTGSRDGVLPLVHRLAHLFHKKVTGSDFTLNNEQATALGPVDPEEHSGPNPQDQEPPFAPNAGRDAHPDQDDSPSDEVAATSANFSHITYGPPNTPVTEQDMARLTRQIGGASSATFFTVGHPSLPVSRIHALAALVKVIAPTPLAIAYRTVPSSRLTPDAATLPLWGRLYLASAIAHGMWPAGRAIHATDPATWAFVRGVIASIAPPPRRSVPNLVAQARHDVEQPLVQVEEAVERTGYTGLVIDAHDMPVQRSMSVRVLDEDGRVVYPDPNHIPDIDWLQDNGMVSYHYDGRDLPRAGRKPLFVRAVRVSGDDFIVSNETADRILAANRRTKFLWRWQVCILQDEAQ